MVQSVADKYVQRLLFIGIGGLVVLSLSIIVIPYTSTLGLLTGYLLSFLFVASNFLLIRKIDLENHKKFLTLFIVSITVRFVLVLVGFALVLTYVKIDQILFTVSFIISYILHSVIEIIFINKILENRHAN